MIRLTREQVREIDRRAIEQYGIPGVVLMENASRAAADVAIEMLDGDCVGEILIVCGGGNNGGDGLAIARHLHNCGADVVVALAVDPDTYKGDALINWRIVTEMKLPTLTATPAIIERSEPLLVIDAIFGTGLQDPPRESACTLIAAINRSQSSVLSIDVPSGLDCDTGQPLGECVIADRTVTFVAEKVGFVTHEARRHLGHVTVAGIGCPLELIIEVLSESATVNS
jgi:NAD(P)H-hydrate epimerase